MNNAQLSPTQRAFAKFLVTLKRGEFTPDELERFVYEREAVPPQLMQSTVQEAIEGSIDLEAFNRELAQEKQDAALLQGVKASLQNAFADMSGNGLGVDQ